MLSNESIERILDIIREEVMNVEYDHHLDWDTYWEMRHILLDRYNAKVAIDNYGHHYVIDKP